MPHPSFPLRRARRGFTFIEVIVILIIIALMLVIIVPHFLSMLKATRADRERADLVTLNSAIMHYALDNEKVAGFQPTYADLRKYLDPQSDIYLDDGKDLFGDTYGPFIVGTPPSVPRNAAERLSARGGAGFLVAVPVEEAGFTAIARTGRERPPGQRPWAYHVDAERLPP